MNREGDIDIGLWTTVVRHTVLLSRNSWKKTKGAKKIETKKARIKKRQKGTKEWQRIELIGFSFLMDNVHIQYITQHTTPQNVSGTWMYMCVHKI